MHLPRLLLLAAALPLAGPLASAQTQTTITNLTGNTGSAPGQTPAGGSTIQASDGNLYGVTQAGGANGRGVVYRVSTTGSGYTVLHDFLFSTIDGINANGELIQASDGNLYGVTASGGTYSYGTVYRLGLDGTFVLIHSFNPNVDGSVASGGLIEGTDGLLYGSTRAGGSAVGTVFSITTSGVFTSLHSLTGADGCAPVGALLQGLDGNFYGVATYGGAYRNGSLFKFSGTSFSTVYSFTGSNDDGLTAIGPPVQAPDGNFYLTTTRRNGTTNSSCNGQTFTNGGGSAGLFRITPAGQKTSLANLTTSPFGGLFLASDGALYGSAAAQLNRYAIDGTITTLATLGDGQFNNRPGQAADGNLYGAQQYGGNGPPTNVGYGPGTVYELQPATALAAPVALSVPASVTARSSFPVSYAVLNGYSLTYRRCFATNTAGDTTDWVGVKNALPTVTTATLLAPANPGTYRYTLTCGGVESGFATLNVIAAPVPAVSSINPTTGPAVGNTSVTITGTGFTSASTVKFGTNAAASVTVNSVTSITAISPAGSGGSSVDVTVTTSGGTSATSASDRFTYQSAQQAQTITFTQPTTPVFAGATATLTATASSGLPVTFSITSGSAYAMLSGTNNSTISYIAPGTVVIAADQPGNSSFQAAPQVTRSVTVTSQSVFITNSGGTVVTRYDNGTGQSAPTAGGGIGAAVWTDGTVFSINSNGTALSRFTDTGAFNGTLTGSSLTGGQALAIDGQGFIWIVNADKKVARFYYSGQANPIGVAAAGNISAPTGILVDTAGSLWISNGGNNTVTEIIGAAAPVATPVVTQVVAAQPATRP